MRTYLSQLAFVDSFKLMRLCNDFLNKRTLDSAKTFLDKVEDFIDESCKQNSITRGDTNGK
jgi:hypothetical protein